MENKIYEGSSEASLQEPGNRREMRGSFMVLFRNAQLWIGKKIEISWDRCIEKVIEFLRLMGGT